jgi:hypothetical protein
MCWFETDTFSESARTSVWTECNMNRAEQEGIILKSAWDILLGMVNWAIHARPI